MKQWQSRDLDLSDPSLKPSPGARTLPGTKGQGPAVPGSVLSPSRALGAGGAVLQRLSSQGQEAPTGGQEGFLTVPLQAEVPRFPLLGPALQEGGWQVLLMSPRLRHCWVLTAA